MVKVAVDGIQIDLAASRLTVCDERQFLMRFPGMRMPVPSMAAISIAVRDLSVAVALLRSNGVRIHVAHGRTWIEPQHAAGAVVELID